MEDRIRSRLNGELAGCSSALDVGCGTGQYLHTLPPNITKASIDPIDRVSKRVSSKRFLQGTAQELLPRFAAGSFDVVYAIDVIEHIDKGPAWIVIDEMKRVAAQRVVLFTPNGFMAHDGSGFSAEETPWQVHRSGWTGEELRGAGFVVEEWLPHASPPKHQWAESSLWAVWSQ